MRKKRLLKILKIVLIILAATGLLWLVFFAISELFLKNTEEEVSGDISFYEADYEENIYEDVLYQSKNNNVFYLEYGSGELITDDNIDDFSANAKFFHSYFESVISGDHENYKKFFTDDFFKNYITPEMFTMQKIYDISVDLYDKQSIAEDNTGIIVETYIVRYKILENNGTFRSDVGSNTIKPLVFELYTIGDSVLINGIYYKKSFEE